MFFTFFSRLNCFSLFYQAKELPTYKDNDFINDGQKIYIDEESKKTFLDKLRKDVEVNDLEELAFSLCLPGTGTMMYSSCALPLSILPSHLCLVPCLAEVDGLQSSGWDP